MWYLHGSDFINSYFGYHLFKRYTSAIEDKGGPWYYYFVVIRNTMRLWFIVLIPSLAFFIYKAYKEKFSKDKVLILISAVIVILFFSTSSSKLKWYIMPIYPFLAVICGYFAIVFPQSASQFIIAGAISYYY
jgi:4-amino-4-deoxy-L-arabinose transferase-like glycosyltransferase